MKLNPNWVQLLQALLVRVEDVVLEMLVVSLVVLLELHEELLLLDVLEIVLLLLTVKLLEVEVVLPNWATATGNLWDSDGIVFHRRIFQ